MNLTSLTLGEIVSANYRSAVVFEKYNLDFCCNGKRSLTEVCKANHLEVHKITEEIKNAATDDSPVDFIHWPLDLLCDYICNRHHHYIEQVTPVIKNLLEKIYGVHGANHAELAEIRDIFFKTSGDLAVHMKKEELILFPFIKKLVQVKQGEKASSNLFNSVASPIQKMEKDHTQEGEQLQRMRLLSNDYTPPSDACMSFMATYKMLKEYESDMHMHIHLENNILFHKALELEKDMTADYE